MGNTACRRYPCFFGQAHTVKEALADYDRHLHVFLKRAQERGLGVNAVKFKYRFQEVSYSISARAESGS